MRKLTTAEFIERARSIHGDRYDYTESEYTGSNKKITVTCRIHGPLKILVTNHYLGQGGCKACASSLHSSRMMMTTAEFVERARTIHGKKYDYTKVQYTGIENHVTIGCPVHGVFQQSPKAHFQGGCTLCGDASCSETKTLSTEEFISRATVVHGGYYSYPMADHKGTRHKVIVTCPVHGDFSQVSGLHLKGKGCTRCKESSGEKLTSIALGSLGLVFETQKRFSSCRATKPLPFDFFVQDIRLLIEYDGEQHFAPIRFLLGEPVSEATSLSRFNKIKRNDTIKNAWAKDNHYRLLRIPYTAKSVPEISGIISEFLQTNL